MWKSNKLELKEDTLTFQEGPHTHTHTYIYISTSSHIYSYAQGSASSEQSAGRKFFPSYPFYEYPFYDSMHFQVIFTSQEWIFVLLKIGWSWECSLISKQKSLLEKHYINYSLWSLWNSFEREAEGCQRDLNLHTFLNKFISLVKY